MADKDKPKVAFSTSALRREASPSPEPFQWATAASKLVTFPNPYEMDADEGEDKLYRWQSGMVKPGQILAEWLSEKDLKALAEDRLNVRERSSVIEAALQYYTEQAGTPGEGSGSEN